jgi:hypothetical protein
MSSTLLSFVYIDLVTEIEQSSALGMWLFDDLNELLKQ